MPANRPRKQHFVPQVYLRNFADSNQHLYVYSAAKTRKSHIRNVACERDFHEFKVGLEQSHGRYEDFLGRIETWAGELTPKVLKGEELSYDETLRWALYLASLFLRTRKMRNDFASTVSSEIASGALSEDGLRKTQFEVFKTGNLVTLDKVREMVVKQTQLLAQYPAFVQFANLTERLCKYAFLLGRNRYSICTDESGSLITNDSPLSSGQIHNNVLSLGHGFEREGTIVFLPLSPSKLLVSGPAGVSSFNESLEANDVAILNNSMVRLADREVFSRFFDDQINADYKTNLGSIKFGRDAFRMRPV